MKKVNLSFLSIMLVGAALSVYAEDVIDENLLFADTNTSVDSASIVESDSVSIQDQKTTVSFSGSVNSYVNGAFSRTFFDSLNRSNVTPSAYLLSYLSLDVRIPKDIKAFTNLKLQYRSDSSFFNIYLQELFIDANIKRKVYFRTGKQVLQWGRCYLWNPTDLINIDRKSLDPLDNMREGAYGVKMHIPFGTTYNIYGFLDMKQMTSVDSVAGALKGEILIGSTEIGAAVWGKQNRKPVFGLDFSTTVFDFDISGEMSLESGENISAIEGLNDHEPIMHFIARAMSGDSTINMNAKVKQKIVPKLSVGLSRSIDVLDVKDRVTFTSEFFLNKTGIPGNFYSDHNVKSVFDAIDKDTTGLLKKQIGNLKDRFSNPNEFSQYYLALLTSVNKFILPEMTFQLNGIINIEQEGAMIIAALQYTTLHNMTLGLTITSAVGGPETEYTISGNALSCRFNAGVNF